MTQVSAPFVFRLLIEACFMDNTTIAASFYLSSQMYIFAPMDLQPTHNLSCCLHHPKVSGMPSFAYFPIVHPW